MDTKSHKEDLTRENPRYVLLEHDGRQRPATENLVPGRQVYGETLITRDNTEWRIWDPHRSKLAAAMLKGLLHLPVHEGSSVLYLGASTGTTVSHVSDIVGHTGRIFAVEHASRVARELLERVATHRSNITPVIQDARVPREYFSVYGKVDVVYSDIAQPDQTEIAISNCRAYLKPQGTLILIIKARSIDVANSPSLVIDAEIEKLRVEFEVNESMGLEPYDRDHALVVAQMR